MISTSGREWLELLVVFVMVMVCQAALFYIQRWMDKG